MFREIVAAYCGRRAKYKYTLREMWRTVNLTGHGVTLSFAELSGPLLPSLEMARLECADSEEGHQIYRAATTDSLVVCGLPSLHPE
jgi:hypothetical protein